MQYNDRDKAKSSTSMLHKYLAALPFCHLDVCSVMLLDDVLCNAILCFAMLYEIVLRCVVFCVCCVLCTLCMLCMYIYMHVCKVQVSEWNVGQCEVPMYVSKLVS